MTKTGFQLSDIGKALTWSGLNSFLMQEREESSFFRELHPEYAKWATTTKTNEILADLFDILAKINANLVALGNGKPAIQPKKYPRPETKKKDNEQRIGRGAMPAKELALWMEEKRRKHARSSKRDIDGDSGPGGGTGVAD